MRFLLGLAALVLLAPAAAAQRAPVVVTGRVMVLDSARAGASVLVRVEFANAGAWTDSAGYYRFRVPPTRFANGDSVMITASRLGLVPERRHIQIADGATVRTDFGMNRQQLEFAFVCDGVFGTPAGSPPRPPELNYKLCRLTHTLRSVLPAQSPALP